MTQREIPPTSGLPLSWYDWCSGADDLASAIGSWLQLPDPLLTCSGTAALIVILGTLKQQSTRHKVVLPAFTCPLVAWAVRYCALDVVLCDLSKDSIDLDLNHLATLLDEQTLAVIPTHLGGRITDVGIVLALAHPLGIKVIEDAAQSLGAKTNGISIGLTGDASFFSLAAGKGLTLYEGGLLVSHNPELRHELAITAKRLLSPSPLTEGIRIAQLLGYTAFYNPNSLYWVYGLPLRRALAADRPEVAVGDLADLDIPLHQVSRLRQRVGCHALERLPSFLSDAQQRGQHRASALTKSTGLHVLTDTQPSDTGIWPFLMVLMPDNTSRDRAMAQLWGAGLGVTRLFIHTLPNYKEMEDFIPTTVITNANDFASRLLTVSNSPWLSDADFEYICQVLATASISC